MHPRVRRGRIAGVPGRDDPENGRLGVGTGTKLGERRVEAVVNVPVRQRVRGFVEIQRQFEKARLYFTSACMAFHWFHSTSIWHICGHLGKLAPLYLPHDRKGYE